MRVRAFGFAVGAFVLLTVGEAAGQQLSDDPTSVCERAARQAERDWRLPQGILAAIGLVESGRRTPAGAFPIIWPWTIDAEGQGFYQPSKAAAVGMARALQRRGARMIDVGCFQVDLFYHPYAFAGLEEAFDPDANARAAARILSLGRFGSAGWDGAIAAYHSAVPLVGAAYLQRVRAAWPWARARSAWGEPEAAAAYAVLLSSQARLVRVVAPFEPAPQRPAGLLPPPTDRFGDGTVSWLHRPAADLPRVVTPASPR